jgi:hypothetical protein
LFGAAGRLVLVVLILASGYGGYVLNDRVLQPQLQKENASKSSAAP